MKTYSIIITKYINGYNLVSQIIPANDKAKSNFLDYLKSDIHWGKDMFNWQFEEGREGSDYVEYTSGAFTAILRAVDYTDPNHYDPFHDDSLTFLEDLIHEARTKQRNQKAA